MVSYNTITTILGPTAHWGPEPADELLDLPPLVADLGERSSNLLRDDVCSACRSPHRFRLSTPTLAIQISSYPNFSRCWVSTCHIHCPKILPPHRGSNQTRIPQYVHAFHCVTMNWNNDYLLCFRETNWAFLLIEIELRSYYNQYYYFSGITGHWEPGSVSIKSV